MVQNLTNIDGTQKTARKLSFNILDLGQAIAVFFQPQPSKKEDQTGCLSNSYGSQFWASIYNKVIKSCWLNILSLIYIEYVSLLNSSIILGSGHYL